MRRRTRVTLIALLAAATLLVTASLADSAPGRRWAPAATAPVHPGVQTVTEAGQCTSNFVFTDASDVYIGQAAHCSGTGGADQTNGCDAGVLPLGSPVRIDGASRRGVLAYNSWVAMQERGEKDAATCASNDFALVRIHPDDRPKVNPSVPFFGGPSKLGTSGARGLLVYSYQNSPLRQGIAALSPKWGINTGTGDAWSRNVYTVTPGIPGDSGSGFLGEDGSAIGVLSTLEVFPRVGSNNVIDLARALEYMHRYSDLRDVRLATGTTPFSSRLLL